MTLNPAPKISEAQSLVYQALRVQNGIVRKASEAFRYAMTDEAARKASEEFVQAERTQVALRAVLESLNTALDTIER